MKLGLVARAENRGLGTMCWEFARHMNPDRTLVVIPEGVRHAHLESHLDRYPGATVVDFNGQLPELACREWLDGLDIVYSSETYYDWRFCWWAEQQHVATVCHVMPEWFNPAVCASPTAWWAPTSWRLERLPEGTKVVPVPIATDRFREQPPRADGPFRWLHVAGARTHFDRNGTGSVLDAARAVTAPQEIIVRTQSDGIESELDCVTVDTRDVENYWDMYRGVDALLMPRRYAGLSLPVLEAFGAGLPVVMTDMAPQNVDWPVCTVPTTVAVNIRMMGGRIPTGDIDVHELARTMDRWATEPDLVHEWRTAADVYAAANSWTARAPQILTELEEVADRVAA